MLTRCSDHWYTLLAYSTNHTLNTFPTPTVFEDPLPHHPPRLMLTIFQLDSLSVSKVATGSTNRAHEATGATRNIFSVYLKMIYI